MEIPNWLLKQASLNPNRVAVNDGTTAYTFAQLVPPGRPPCWPDSSADGPAPGWGDDPQ